MEQAAVDEAVGWAKAPPYVSYRAFRGYIDRVAAQGLPSVVQRDDLERLHSGTVAVQLLAALRFLRLIDEHDQPTDQFQHLRDALRERGWPQAWGEVIEAAYAPIIALGLTSLA